MYIHKYIYIHIYVYIYIYIYIDIDIDISGSPITSSPSNYRMDTYNESSVSGWYR